VFFLLTQQHSAKPLIQCRRVIMQDQVLISQTDLVEIIKDLSVWRSVATGAHT